MMAVGVRGWRVSRQVCRRFFSRPRVRDGAARRIPLCHPQPEAGAELGRLSPGLDPELPPSPRLSRVSRSSPVLSRGDLTRVELYPRVSRSRPRGNTTKRRAAQAQTAHDRAEGERGGRGSERGRGGLRLAGIYPHPERQNLEPKSQHRCRPGRSGSRGGSPDWSRVGVRCAEWRRGDGEKG